MMLCILSDPLLNHQAIKANETGRHALWFSLCFILVTACVLFLAIFGNLDTNEGWYGNDTYLVMSGKRIYQDFFYHRLPLFIQTYALVAKITGASLLKLRLISSALAVLLVLQTYLFLRRITNKNFALIGILFYLSCFDILRYYTTIQTYSLTALLLLAIVFISYLKIDLHLKCALIGLLSGVTQWMRYPIDYIPLVFITYLLACHYRNGKAVFISIVCFVTTHVILLAIYYSPEFSFDVWHGMFQAVPMTLKNTLQYKSQWVFFSVVSYPAILLIGGLLIIHFAVKRSGIWAIMQKIFERDWLFFTLLLITGNTGMYLVAETGHPVQIAYVLPLIIIVTVYMLYNFYQVLSKSNKRTVRAGVFFILLFGLFVNERHFNLHIKHTHLLVMNAIGQKIKNITTANDRLLVFGPAYGISSCRSLVDGLEFELFGYMDDGMSSEAIKRYHLMNDQELMGVIRRKKMGAVIINDRFLYPKAMGIKLKKVRENILRILDQEYEQVNIDEGMFQDVLGIIKVYRPVGAKSRPFLGPRNGTK